MTIIKATRCAPLQNQSLVCVVMVTLSLIMLLPSQAQPRLVKQFTVANSMRAEKTNAQHTAMNQSMAVAQATFGKEFRALILRVVIVSTVVTPRQKYQQERLSESCTYCISAACLTADNYQHLYHSLVCGRDSTDVHV